MKQIFINLPVNNVEVSLKFYTAIGFTVNPLFTFENQKCVTWSDQIFVMLQTHEMFKSGNKKNLVDPKDNTIATFTLPVESIEKLNEMVENGLKSGGKELINPMNEEFMKVRNIEDPDGHQWGIIFLDIDKFKKITGK